MYKQNNKKEVSSSDKYICYSAPKEQTGHKGSINATSNDRSLFYDRSIGKRMVYRGPHLLSSAKVKTPLSVFEFDSKAKAQRLCNRVNKAYNEDFKPLKISYHE